MKAPECAGIIHTDFQKGFIKAEIMSFDDLKEYGSELKVKEAGKLRLEEKTISCKMVIFVTLDLTFKNN